MSLHNFSDNSDSPPENPLLRNNRFPRAERLRGKRNFALFARAKQYRGKFLRVAAVYREERKTAVTVSKKVAPHAVDRNRLKRRLRELYKKCRFLLPKDVWLMIIALPGAAHADFSALQADLEELFHKAASKNAGNLRR